MTDEFSPTEAALERSRALVDEVRSALAAVLVDASGDPHTVLVVGEALSVLHEASPPYPPLIYPAEGCPPGEGLPRALAALTEAGGSASNVADAARFAHVADILRRLPDAGV